MATEASQKSNIESLGKYDNFSHYGYNKYLISINYANMTSKARSFSFYSYDNGIIEAFGTEDKWEDIIPGSKTVITIEIGR